MAKRLQFLPEAFVEIGKIADWYADQNSQIAERFLATLERILSSIVRNPHRGAFHDAEKRHRFRRVGRFPYLVVYREESEDILIVAVYHTSRRPDFWQERLE